MSIPLEHETLRMLWWVLLGILLIGFAIIEGFNLGVAIWLPSLTRTQIERRILINSIAPTWESNQAWFILGDAAIFSACLMLYTLSFSGIYLAISLSLLTLMLRSLRFKYRSKIDSPTWRKLWDNALFLGGFVPALIFGVAIGNVLQGVLFHFDAHLRPFYPGTFRDLLNPLGLWCGMLSVLMFSMHGAFFLVNKTEGHLQQRARHAARSTAMLVIFFFAAAGVWLYFKTGCTLKRIMPHTWLITTPILGICMPLIANCLVKRTAPLAFVCSAIGLAAIISSLGLIIFPFILPSSSQPSFLIMLITALIFFSLMIAYTAWAYRILREKVTETSIFLS